MDAKSKQPILQDNELQPIGFGCGRTQALGATGHFANPVSQAPFVLLLSGVRRVLRVNNT
jgi:hypothetical protein